MTVYSNAAASGSSSAALGMTFPTLLLVKLGTIGGLVNQPPAADSDQTLNAGWVAFGTTQNPFGDGNEVYWYEVIWLNFRLLHWPRDPTRISAAYAQLTADTIRWHLSPGTIAKLYVFGT